MKYVFIAIFALALGLGVAGKVFGEEAQVEQVVLTTTNFSALRDEVNVNTVNSLLQGITNSDPKKPFYLFLDSPGGSVIAGRQLVNYLTTTDRQIICIARTAISMAYVILQACPVRLVTNDAILMTHQIASGTQGSLREMQAAVTFTQKLADYYETLIANRMGLTLEYYRTRILPEWWMVGAADSIGNKAADKEVSVSCTKELEKAFKVFGDEGSQVKVSNCPIA